MTLINRLSTSALRIASIGLLLASGGCVPAKQKGKITLHYLPNGEQKITYPSGEDPGTYRITNGEFGNKWTVLKKGVESCNSLYMVDTKSYDFIKKDGGKSGKLLLNNRGKSCCVICGKHNISSRLESRRNHNGSIFICFTI